MTTMRCYTVTTVKCDSLQLNPTRRQALASSLVLDLHGLHCEDHQCCAVKLWLLNACHCAHTHGYHEVATMHCWTTGCLTVIRWASVKSDEWLVSNIHTYMYAHVTYISCLGGNSGVICYKFYLYLLQRQ